jgi:hypothetical protein
LPDRRRSAALTLGFGAALALAAQIAAPVGVPLYDGVVVQEPYRYLVPASGQAGNPTTYAADKPVSNGAAPAFVASTKENPPQAQLIALPGAFVAGASATTLKISIQPVPAPATVPASGSIVGNVYRFSVTDQSGAVVPIAAGADHRPTMTLRGPDGVTDASIARLTASGWQILDTQQGGALALFSTNPTELGDFAVVVAANAGPSLPVIVGAVLAIAVPIAFVAFLLVRRQRARTINRVLAEADRARRRGPSKRPTQRPPKGGRREP